MQISFISTDALLRIAKEHGKVGRGDRRWSFSEAGKLIPTGGVNYLYRGQVRRYSPCLPAISRSARTYGRRLADLPRERALDVVENLIRAEWFTREIAHHPALRWAATKQIVIPRIELAQHYGVPTGLIDVTESVEVALFFATHEFPSGVAQPCSEGVGILYRFDWAHAPTAVSSRFHPIAIQPFARPFRQHAWSCELMLGESFEACPGLEAVEFEHDLEFAAEIRRLAEAAGELFPRDPLAEVASVIRNSPQFPMAATEHVLADVVSDPGGLPGESVASVAAALAARGRSTSAPTEPVLGDGLLDEAEATWRRDGPSFASAIAAGFDLWLTRTRQSASMGASGDPVAGSSPTSRAPASGPSERTLPARPGRPPRRPRS